jgi:hypothetical protein
MIAAEFASRGGVLVQFGSIGRAIVFVATVMTIALGVEAAPAVAADTIYWGNFGSTAAGTTISFANLAGGGGGQLDTSGATVSAPDGLAIDSPTGRLYWANFGFTGNGTTISFANLGGGNGGNLGAPGATVSGPAGPAIDPVARKIYWTNANNTISFANLNGTGGGQLSTTGASVNAPNDVGIDPAANKIYWVNGGNNTIDFANLDGTGGGGQLNTGTATVNFPNGLVIDKAAGRIYWANGGSTAHPVSYANLNGGGAADLNTAGADNNSAFGLALDPAAGKLYWGNFFDNEISFASTNGSGGGVLNTAGAPLDGPGFPVLLKSPSGTGAPTITGGTKTGSPLTCSTGSWAPDLVGDFLYQAPQSFTYSWTRDGIPIAAATANSIDATTPGAYACQVTATNHAGSATQASASHPVVSPPPPPPPPPSCTLKPAGARVFASTTKKHRRGVLKLTARCDQAATLLLAGNVTARLKPPKGKKHGRIKTFKLTAVHASATANKSRTLTVKLPKAALTALKRRARESVTFKLTATNANGSGTSSATIKRLKLVLGKHK